MFQFSASSFAASILLIYFHLPSLVAITIGDAFTIKSGTIDGGCDNYGIELEQFWKDSQMLAQSGADVFDDAAVGNQNALAALLGYFGITGTSDEGLVDIKDRMDGVNEFFTTGVVPNPPEEAVKPWLFCDSDWVIQYERTDVALNDLGEPWPFDDGGNLNPPRIEQIKVYEEYLFLANSSPNQNVPWWSIDIKEYIFYIPAEGRYYCNEAQNLGSTQTETVPDTVTLCMKNIINNKPAKDAVLGTTPAVLKRFVKSYVPQGATLFHEAFHLVFGTQTTRDATYKLPTIQKVVRSMRALTIVPATTDIDNPDDPNAFDNDDDLTQKQLIGQNPETFVFFATAYWVYQNNDKKFTLATGTVKATTT